MTESALLLERLAEDDALRTEFERDPARVVDRYELGIDEREAFIRLDLGDLEELVRKGVQPIECRILRITW